MRLYLWGESVSRILQQSGSSRVQQHENIRLSFCHDRGPKVNGIVSEEEESGESVALSERNRSLAASPLHELRSEGLINT